MASVRENNPRPRPLQEKVDWHERKQQAARDTEATRTARFGCRGGQHRSADYPFPVRAPATRMYSNHLSSNESSRQPASVSIQFYAKDRGS